MNKQIFSDKYDDDKEVINLIDEIEGKYKDIQGTIFYKFPTVKEFDCKFRLIGAPFSLAPVRAF